MCYFHRGGGGGVKVENITKNVIVFERGKWKGRAGRVIL